MARILCCLFDCQLWFTYINCWADLLNMNLVFEVEFFPRLLSTAPFLFSPLFHWHLCLTSCSSIHPPGYGCLFIYAVGLISWLIFSCSPCYLFIYIVCLFPSPASLRSQCCFIYGRESLFSTACSLCFCHDLLQYQLIMPNIAKLRVLCFSVLCVSLVEFSSSSAEAEHFFYHINFLAPK